MATMLSVVLTDATADPATLHALLRGAAARDVGPARRSTATPAPTTRCSCSRRGRRARPTPRATPARVPRSAAAIEAVARDLARQQAADGEGATALVTCQVTGAADDADARAIARAVISSSLVKAAVHGRDANWGRIAGAAGNARSRDAAGPRGGGPRRERGGGRAGTPARLDTAALRIAIAGHLVYDGPSGGPVDVDKAAARVSMGGARS